jgi:hypothetical protein
MVATIVYVGVQATSGIVAANAVSNITLRTLHDTAPGTSRFGKMIAAGLILGAVSLMWGQTLKERLKRVVVVCYVTFFVHPAIRCIGLIGAQP